MGAILDDILIADIWIPDSTSLYAINKDKFVWLGNIQRVGEPSSIDGFDFLWNDGILYLINKVWGISSVG